jgi:hypothetical protein
MREVAWGMIVLLGLTDPSWGEPVILRFFPCGVVQFFDEPCPPAAAPVVPVPEIPAIPSDPPAPVPPPPPAAPGPRTASETTGTLPPLFTPETVSPDMPPLLLQLLQEPTEAHARAFLAWHQARLQRIREVQALLRAFQAADLERARTAGQRP